MEELDKVENHILRDTILDLNTRQLELVSHMAKNYFIMEYIDLNKLKNDNFLIKGLDNSVEKNRLEDVFDELLNRFLDLASKKEFVKEDILILREEIYNYSDVLSAYYIELEYIKNKMDDMLARDRAKSLELLPNLDVSRENLIEDIDRRIISLRQEPREYMNFMATVVNVLPFKLSKYKYYNILEETLRLNLKDYSTDYALYQIQEYKKQFAPRLNKGYGLYFDEYFTQIEEAHRLEVEELTINYMKEYIRRFNVILDDIGYNMMNIRRIGILTNRLLTMVNIGEECEIDFDQELIKSFTANSKGVGELVRSEFLKNEKELFSLVDEFQAYNDESYKREDYSYNLDEEFEKARKMLVYYNDLEFTPSEILNIDDRDSRIDGDYLDKIINSFIDFIRRNLEDMDIVDGRLRMKKLLTVLTPSFKSTDSFMDYVKYGLDSRIISDRELNVVIMSLNYIMNAKENSDS